MAIRAMMPRGPEFEEVVMRCHSAVLCVVCGDGERRPKVDLDHAASADGAQIDAMTGEDCVALAIIGVFDSDRRRLRCLESSADGWKLGGAAGVRPSGSRSDGCEAEPAFGSTWSKETTDELISVERHHLETCFSAAIILPTKTDATVLTGEEPTVGDRDAMRRSAPRILQHLLRPAEGAFGI